ncbi:MAG: hypothetical protein FWG14_12855 [Peptococcaceae bacterium]|nr:hypothetical protein [Peptococcaceae bacterium]
MHFNLRRANSIVFIFFSLYFVVIFFPAYKDSVWIFYHAYEDQIRDIIDAAIKTLSIVTGSLFIYTINHIIKDDEYGITRIALFKTRRSRVLPILSIAVGAVACWGYLFYNENPLCGLLILVFLSYLIYEFCRLFLRTSHTISKYIEKHQHQERLHKENNELYKRLPTIYLKNIAAAAAKPENRYFAFLTYKKYLLRCVKEKEAIESTLFYNTFFTAFILFERLLGHKYAKDFIRDCFMPLIKTLLKEYKKSTSKRSVILVLAQLFGAAMILGFDKENEGSTVYVSSNLDQWVFDPTRKSIWTEIRSHLDTQNPLDTDNDYQEFLSIFLLLLEGVLNLSNTQSVSIFSHFRTFPEILKHLKIEKFVGNDSQAIQNRYAIILDVYEILLRFENHYNLNLLAILDTGFENLIMDRQNSEAFSLPRNTSKIMQNIMKLEQKGGEEHNERIYS